MALASYLCAAPAIAAQFGMVVGVDDYRHFDPFPAPVGELSDLEGAVNDATRIAASMRNAGIDLTDNRLLTNGAATVENFLAGWQDMISKARPGDTIIVSFSGHGGQEKEVSEPFDENTDGLDETIMFHEFDPDNARIGRLNDDQLRALLAAAAPFNVIWVMDSCHSAGLTRNVNTARMGLTRSGGVWDIPLDPIEGEITAADGDDNTDELPNVTQILATASEDRLVTETRFEGKAHGALSWFFAQALDGAADLDNNGSVTRAELSGFLEDRVFAHMNQTQQPRILPRGDNKQAFLVADLLSMPTQSQTPKAQSVPVHFIGDRPPGLVAGSFSEVNTNALLTFEQSGDTWIVLNHTGDRITTLRDGADVMVARAAALAQITRSKRDGIAPVRIRTAQDSTSHRIGETVGFNFAPPRPNMGYLTLFNLASNGSVQFLYPLSESDNLAMDSDGFPIRFQVALPVGEDQLVAIFCTRPPLDLQKLLQSLNNQTVPSDDRLSVALHQGDCQTGLTGLFTSEN
ncbi:hypothetical protein C1J02_04755 [Sulfitobacter sp. SK011]|nr:hypothetical protein C1J02_04755 [Sulfitobacter sp. SK011]